jgi:hypothetical protein
MGLPALILPQEWLAPTMSATMNRGALEPFWSARRDLCRRVGAARPLEGTEAEANALMDFVNLAFSVADAFGRDILAAVRGGIEHGLVVILEAELQDAPVQRKLALRHLGRATETFGLFVETANAVMQSGPPDAVDSVSGLLTEQATEHRLPLDEDSRCLLRFELNLMMAYDALDAADEELAYWAMKAVSSARQVQAVQLPRLAVSIRSEIARVRARRGWDGWDSAEIEREMAPWTASTR